MSDKEYKCPYCGKLFSKEELQDLALTPTHDFPAPCRQVCPGSRQYSRGLSDKRVLWKDEK